MKNKSDKQHFNDKIKLIKDLYNGQMFCFIDEDHLKNLIDSVFIELKNELMRKMELLKQSFQNNLENNND